MAVLTTCILTFIDLNEIHIGTMPTNPVNDQIWFDTASNVLKKYNSTNATWEIVNDYTDDILNALKGLQVSSRNLLASTSYESQIVCSGGANKTGGQYYFVGTINYVNNIKDKEVTLAFDWEIVTAGTPSGTFRAQTTGVEQIQIGDIITLSNSNYYGTCVFTTTLKTASTINGINFRTDGVTGTFKITHPRLFYGSKDLGWSQAPEDIDGKFETIIDKQEQGIYISVTDTGNNTKTLVDFNSQKLLVSSSNIDLQGYVTISSLSDPNSTTTIDGNLIETDTLSANKVKTGKLQGKNSNSYFNLDNGTFSLANSTRSLMTFDGTSLTFQNNVNYNLDKDDFSSNLGWVKNWTEGATVINSKQVMSPRAFFGTVNASKQATGISIGGALNEIYKTEGTYSGIDDGLAGYKLGTKMFHFKTDGTLLIGSSTTGNYISWDGNDLNLRASNINIGSESVATGTTVNNAVNNAVNNIQVGGKNLILESKNILLNFSDNGNDNCCAIENDYVKISPINNGNVYNLGSIKTSNTRYQNQTYTLSFDILTPTAIEFYWYPSEYYSDKNYISASNKWQRIYFTYTQTGLDSNSSPLFGFHQLVAGNIYCYRNLKLELGNKGSDWSPAPQDVDNYIIKTASEINQSVDALQLKFTQSGGYNLIKNSTGASGNTNGWTHNGTSLGVSSNDSIGSNCKTFIYLDNETTTTERFAFSSRFKLKPNTKYTLTGYYYNYTTCPNFDVWLLSSTTLSDSDTTTNYTNAQAFLTAENTAGIWKKLTATITTPTSTISGFLRIDHNGYNSAGTGANRICWNALMLVEGELENVWSQHPSEIYEGITSIDKNGIVVTSSNVKSRTTMSSSGFKITKTDTSEDVFSVNSDGTLNIKGNINGGSINLSNNFIVASNGNVTTAGSVTLGGTVTASNLTINGGSININSGKFIVDSSGNVTTAGNVNLGGTINANGNITASNLSLTGGSINLSNVFTVDSSGNVNASGNVTLGGNVNSTGTITASTLNLNGGSININNNFKVNTNGDVTANNLALTGGSININNGTFMVDNQGNVTTTGKVIISSQATVPSSTLSGSILSNQLDSSITSDISTAKLNSNLLAQGLNKWMVTAYDITGAGYTNATIPTFNMLANKNIKFIKEVLDSSASISMSLGDNYIGHAKTNIYLDSDYSFLTTLTTDDAGAIYLNGTLVTTTVSCTAKSITLNLKAGWNTVEVLYVEITGGDGFVFSPKFSAITRIKRINAYEISSTSISSNLISESKDLLDINKSNWSNAYNRVLEWASGAVTGSTTINGGLIETNTITAKQIAIGDFNNYSQLTKGKNLSNRFGTATWVENASNDSYWQSSSSCFPFTINETNNPFKAGDKIQIKLDACTVTSRSVSVGIWFYSDIACATNIGNVTGSISCSSTWGTKSVNLTLPEGDSYVQSAKSVAILISNGSSGEVIQVRNAVVIRQVAGDLIVDGTITTSHINTTGLDASVIKAGTISADRIDANTIVSKVNGATTTITGDKITTGTILAEKISIGDFSNYSELNSDTLSKWGFTSEADTSAANNPWFVRNSLTRYTPISKYYDCNGGETIRIKADISTTVYGQSVSGGTATPAPRGIRMMIVAKDATGTLSYLTNSDLTVTATSETTATVATVNGVIKLADNIREFSLQIQINGYATYSGVLKLRNVLMNKMSNGELIVDGSIKSNHIDTDSIRAEHIDASSISSDHVDINGNGFTFYSSKTFNSSTNAYDYGDTIFSIKNEDGQNSTVTIKPDSFILKGRNSTNTSDVGIVLKDNILTIDASAITTGILDASLITAGELDASIIKGGTIKGHQINTEDFTVVNNTTGKSTFTVKGGKVYVSSSDFIITPEAFDINTLTDNNSLISELTKEKDRIDQYIRFNSGTIELGEKSGNYKATLTNNALTFYEKGSAVSWIQGNTMYMTNNRSTDSLEIGPIVGGGRYRWDYQDNGHLNLSWFSN